MDLVEPFLKLVAPAEVWFSAGNEPPLEAEVERRGIEHRWTGRDGPLWIGLPP